MHPAQIPDLLLPGLTDTHCHLEDPAFDMDRRFVIERMQHAGMTRVLLAGTDLADSQSAAQLAREYPNLLRFAAGIHPHAAQQMDHSMRDALQNLLQEEGAVAVGEIGLDYFRDHSPRADQRRAFQEQLALAREMNLPIIVHIRDAVEDALAILAEAAPPRVGVWHAFSGDRILAEKAIAMGFYVGAAGPVTYPKATALREAFRTIPLERILVETDAPYLPPQGNRGARNEPVLVGEVIHQLALDRNLTPVEMAAAVRENANRLFEWE
jgi:TatD DNase family protein